MVQHGGSMDGYKSELFFLPDAGVGAVLLTNADSGDLLTAPFKRRVLELLYGGKARSRSGRRSTGAVAPGIDAKASQRIKCAC